jgi:MFS family permease
VSKKQIIALFVCSLVPWAVGNGLVPLLPIYATRLGADPAIAGYYLSISYLSLAVGTVAAGWLSDNYQRRKIFIIIAGLVNVPITWLLGQVGNIWGLTGLTVILWFYGGLAISFIGILTGLSAGEQERGKIFGIISLTNGLGALLGSLATGYMVDRWGYTQMFTVLAIFTLVLPLSGLFLEEKQFVAVQAEVDERQLSNKGLGGDYYLLFSASLIASVAGFIIVLGRSLLMDNLGFGALAITSTGAIGGLITMPLPFIMGWLSDRYGRKIFIAICYLAGLTSLIILIVSTVLWHFWVVLVLQTLLMVGNWTVGNALVTDIIPKESIGRGLAWFGATSWIGGVIGFAGAGYAFLLLGTLPTFVVGLCLPIISLVLTTLIRSKEGVYHP